MRMAVERLFEIISEASRFIPADLKARQDDISWQRIADLGNWLRHAYHRIDAEILWNIAHNDLDPLKRFVEEVVRSGELKYTRNLIAAERHRSIPVILAADPTRSGARSSNAIDCARRRTPPVSGLPKSQIPILRKSGNRRSLRWLRRRSCQPGSDCDRCPAEISDLGRLAPGHVAEVGTRPAS